MKRMLLAVLLLTLIPLLGFAETGQLTIAGYELVKQEKIGAATCWRYTYRVSVTNTGQTDRYGVTATMETGLESLTVGQGVAAFGDVPAGSTVRSSNMVKIQSKGEYTLNEADLAWTVSYVLGSGTIGPAGGTVSSSDGTIALNIPAGAILQPTVVSIVQNTGDNPGEYHLLPEGLPLLKPVSVLLRYEPTSVPPGADEADMVLAQNDNDGWTEAQDSVVSLGDKTVSGSISSFGLLAAKPKCAPGSGRPFGEVWGELNGVKVLSNQCVKHETNQYNCNYDSDVADETKNPPCGKGDSLSTNTGIRWQAAEFVNRYYYQYFGTNLRSLYSGNASNYLTNAVKMGLAAFPNGGVVPPEKNDIIVASGSGGGHAAIAGAVNSDNITVAHQNFNDANYDTNVHLNFPLALTSANGKYTLAKFDSSHAVTGWLRRGLFTKWHGFWKTPGYEDLEVWVEVKSIAKGKITVLYSWGKNQFTPKAGHGTYTATYTYDKGSNALLFTWKKGKTYWNWIYDIDAPSITGTYLSPYATSTITMWQE